MDLQLPWNNFLQYANDIVIYSSLRQVGETVANLQSSLNMIYLYLSNKSLELSPQIQLDLIF